MLKILITSIVILGLLLYFKLNKKKYIVFILSNSAIERKYIKQMIEYGLGYSKLLKRELILQNAVDIIGDHSKWSIYFDMNSFPKNYSGKMVRVVNGNIDNKMNTKYYDMNDPLCYTKCKNNNSECLGIVCQNNSLSVLSHIVDEPIKIKYNILIENTINNIKKLLGKYIILSIYDGTIIINGKYRVTNLELQLKRLSIQTILLLNDTDAFEFLKKKYNIVKIDELEGICHMDDYFKYIIINEL